MIDVWTIIFLKLIPAGPIRIFNKVWTTHFSSERIVQS